ncbi:MAG: phosphate/phosphite/phosphonate ABC transporter substrate-binding protein [Chromatiaceae bacterium]|nr:phosphate/phosphite/phosphonate ABC transporter substrate-binding protein [Gammaproteobacteria bacterium]MCP5318637.1 phosphate/phosphite/phosphonate ABC transporter substrate-binding protein [Chromatiaceae bacterium]MCP5430423.1 phosphate/phosphite/phosphonate ABC transporter substrate-binding protein [Chromatiaceae bacterium]MCP5435274.1 phosphate/phosphite/phosphonate ABC transporter substrate-binding protein [Chromatiaceae bacterium]
MKNHLLGFVLATVVMSASSVGIGAQKTLTFGIVPQQAASKLATLWGPILKHLSEASGYDIVFQTAPDIPTFERRVLAGEYDIAYMNPYHFTVFNQRPGYRAMARQSEKRIKGIIVVRKDSPLTSLVELDGSKLAFPAPAAFAASVLPRSELNQQGVHFEPMYVSSHDSVYRSVAKGLFPAGGGIQRTFDNVAPEVREQLRVLWTTKGYTPHAIAAHPAMDADTFARVQQALLGMNDSPEGRSLLAAIKFKGVEKAADTDWDDVRALQIDLLADMLK